MQSIQANSKDAKTLNGPAATGGRPAGGGGRRTASDGRRAAATRRPRYETWDSTRVRALRQHLGYTQQQLSEELGTRQQTVSEWETGVYQPRGASAKLLSVIAERCGFRYGEKPNEQ